MIAHMHQLGWHHEDWSDFELHLVVAGRPLSYKRGKQIVWIGGRPSIGLTAKAKAYMQNAVAQLRAQWLLVFKQPLPGYLDLNASIKSYLPTRQLADASNLYQGVEDAMQMCGPKCKINCAKHAGVITDDVQIRTHNGSDRLYDKDNPRVEIVLTPYRGGHA